MIQLFQWFLLRDWSEADVSNSVWYLITLCCLSAVSFIFRETNNLIFLFFTVCLFDSWRECNAHSLVPTHLVSNDDCRHVTTSCWLHPPIHANHALAIRESWALGQLLDHVPPVDKQHRHTYNIPRRHYDACSNQNDTLTSIYYRSNNESG